VVRLIALLIEDTERGTYYLTGLKNFDQIGLDHDRST
jgi:hypothetical protein